MLSAGIALAPSVFKWGSHAWKGIEKVKQFQRAPEEIRFTSELCCAILEPVMVAEALATRHLSLRIVGEALLMCQRAISNCVALISEDPSDGDTEEGWKAPPQTPRMLSAMLHACKTCAQSTHALWSYSLIRPQFAFSVLLRHGWWQAKELLS